MMPKVFYQSSAEWLPPYFDLGLSLFKLGDEARVDLLAFSLLGKQHDALRSDRNKFGKLGYRFKIRTVLAVDALLPVYCGGLNIEQKQVGK